MKLDETGARASLNNGRSAAAKKNHFNDIPVR
jgi:hypothetical protein